MPSEELTDVPVESGSLRAKPWVNCADHLFLLKSDVFTWTRSRLVRWKWEEVYALEHTLRQMYYSEYTILSPVSD